MCGFTGIVNLNKLSDKEFLERKLQKAHVYIKSRGPDERGLWHDQNSYFLHSRLKIIDLNRTSSQPMVLGDHVITYNGEIYNFKELKKILISNGFSFKSSGDTEVLLNAWKFWGPDVLEKLDGMFAFSIWDRKKRILYLARDRFGKKPLVFSLLEETLAFSSDIRSLREIAYEGEIDKLAVRSLFRFRFIHEPLTIYKNFKKLPAGYFLRFCSEGIKIKKWFNLDSKIIHQNKKTYKKKILDLTTKAVEKRLISDVPLGVFLSGGIDSGVISACLAKLDKKVPHFTVGFKNQGDYYNEINIAKKLTEYFGFEHNIIYLNQKKVNPLVNEIISTCDEPFADSSAIPSYMIAKEVSNNLKVALSGDGGDEIFGGYRKYIAYRWNSFFKLIPDSYQKSLGKFLPNFKHTSLSDKIRKLKRYLLNANPDLNKMQINFLDQLSDIEYYMLFGESKHYTENEIFKDITPIHDDLNQLLARDVKFSLPNDMLVKVDRYSMRHSLEVRSPFLDKDLVSYAFSISGKKKIGFFKGKKILRDTFMHMFPRNYLNLPKRGFEVPIDRWLLSDLKYLVDKASSKKVLDFLSIKNKNVIDNWKDEFFAGKADNSWKLWTLVNFSKWAEFNKYI